MYIFLLQRRPQHHIRIAYPALYKDSFIFRKLQGRVSNAGIEGEGKRTGDKCADQEQSRSYKNRDVQ